MTKTKTCVYKMAHITSESELQMWRGEHGSQGDGLLPTLHGGCGEGGGREVRIVGIVKKIKQIKLRKGRVSNRVLTLPNPLFKVRRDLQRIHEE